MGIHGRLVLMSPFLLVARQEAKERESGWRAGEGGGEIEQPIFLGDFLLARRSKQPLGRNRKRRRRYLFYNNNDTLRAKHTGRAQPQDECS